MGEVFELKNARIELDVREGYVHLIAEGTLADLAEVDEHNAIVERFVSRCGIRRVLMDARRQGAESSPEVRTAVWDWMKSGRAFDQIAYVLAPAEELRCASINMTALSFGLNLRAFVNVLEAHRFLTAKRRHSTTGFPVTRNTPQAMERVVSLAADEEEAVPPKSAKA